MTTKPIKINDNLTIGDNSLTIIAGPCAVESRTSLFNIARDLVRTHISILRGGAFKPRTSPNSFQGLGVEALAYLKEASEHFNLPVISEMMSEKDSDLFNEHVDLVQIGSRNMQNFSLLKEIGTNVKKPVLLKRGFSNTVAEFLNAAEYLIKYGNENIILCERGIRTFETITRNTLDISAVAYVKEHTPFPIIVDPSHALGRKDLITPITLAGVACGADGIMVEVHDNPKMALSDAEQALTPYEFAQLIDKLKPILTALGREIAN